MVSGRISPGTSHKHTGVNLGALAMFQLR